MIFNAFKMIERKLIIFSIFFSDFIPLWCLYFINQNFFKHSFPVAFKMVIFLWHFLWLFFYDLPPSKVLKVVVIIWHLFRFNGSWYRSVVGHDVPASRFEQRCYVRSPPEVGYFTGSERLPENDFQRCLETWGTIL